MAQLKKGRKLTEEETKEVLSISPNSMDEKMFTDYFANTFNKEARFLTYDTLTIPKGTLFNDVSINTTIGKLFFNLYILEYDLLKLVKYQNYPMSKKGLGTLGSQIDKLLLDDVISPTRYIKYLDKLDQMYAFVMFLGTSLTLDLVKPTPRAQALKDELIVKHEKELKEGKYEVMSNIEKQVLKVAQEEVKNVPDFEIYESGATGKIDNSFKNSTYFRGAIRNLADESKYTISTASLLDGIPPEEMYLYGDIIVQASYGRAIGTREGGYEYKKIAAALQGLVLDDEGTDCGTKKYHSLNVTKELTGMLKYRYIIEEDKEGKEILTMLTEDNISKYVGKTVKLRSPMYCCSDKYCSKCSGELFYKIDGLKNVGLVANRVGTSLLNASLKAFHDLSLKLVDINIEDYIE